MSYTVINLFIIIYLLPALYESSPLKHKVQSSRYFFLFLFLLSFFLLIFTHYRSMLIPCWHSKDTILQ